MRFEIRPDGKRYRVVRHSQEEYRGGSHNTMLRNKSYVECEDYVHVANESMKLGIVGG